MSNRENKYSLSNDREAALEIVILQEAAALANDRIESQKKFLRNDKLSHIVHAFMNFIQIVSICCNDFTAN